MAEEPKAKVDALRADLARTLELKERLEQALIAADADRSELRREVRILDARVSHLHHELAVAHHSQTDLHIELGAVHTERARLKTALDAALGRVGETPDPVVEAAPAAASEEQGESVEIAEEEHGHGELAQEHEERAETENLEGEGDAAEEAEPPPVRLAPVVAPVAIEVRDLEKRFKLSAHQMETLKERVLHPLRSRRQVELVALDRISFAVRAGEFMGVVGANGSGKSTLLKILASVYAADAGSVWAAGRVAPFIELGVGLNPELAAFDNVVMSGVMMGLEPDAARALYPEIIAFAGLEPFAKMKLKNYSSGMRVRLAFAVMAQVDADILLVDEVLAVGDAEFREKCLDRLHQLRDNGKTIVFVSHAMDVVKAHCDRAILLENSKIALEGDPAEVADHYLDKERDSSGQGVTLTAVQS